MAYERFSDPDKAIRTLASGLSTSVPVIKRMSKQKALSILAAEAGVARTSHSVGEHFADEVKRIEDAP